MKKINKQMNGSWLQRLTLFVISLICMVGSAHAGTSTSYYSAKASVNPSGSGQVYVSPTSTNNPSYQDAPMSINGSATGYFGQTPTQDVYFYATPNAGYTFNGWKKNGSGNYVSTSLQYLASQVEVTGSRLSRTQINYTACFTKNTGLVKVQTTNASRGYVLIDNPNNGIGDEVTITAIPDASQGIVFLGWKTTNSSSASYITTDNPYTLTVSTETQGTYYAFFSEPATSVYCILKNHDTGKFLCLYGDNSATAHTSTYTYQGTTYDNVKDGFYFDKGLSLVSESDAVNNPMVVFKRYTTVVNNTEVGYLATDVKMTSGGITDAISTNALMNGSYSLSFSPSPKYSGSYRISTKYTSSVSGQSATFDSYLCDDGNTYATMKSFTNIANATGVDWDITFLTEEQVSGAFGAKANSKYTKDGKYYTSMYAPFAYKLLDGVTAYYVNPDEDNYNEETNTFTLTAIESGEIVPANMPVIIECGTAGDATANRLLPMGGPADYPIEGEYAKNLLIGYNLIYSRDSGTQNTVANDHDYMYVFSIKHNDLGFYHYSGSTIPSNKAYLKFTVTWEDISEELQSQANNIKFAFGANSDDEDVNSINLFNEVVDDADQPIFNLQGVQVKNPEKGIYIRGGKKYLVK